MNWNSNRLISGLCFLAAACSVQEVPQPAGEAEGAVLTISLPAEESKTSLGDKREGKYPTFWSEGDCLQLNGVSSLPLSAADAGKNAAEFVFRGGLSSPFNILYPVSGGTDEVVFPAEQSYVKDSFDPKAAPMWGSSTVYEDVSLNHFSSLLRVSITATEPRVLRTLGVTSVGNEPLSGTFRAGTGEDGLFDGRLIPVSTEPSVFCSFGADGLSLAAGEKVTVYVAIPAGEYAKGFKASLSSSSSNPRQLKFFSSGRSIAAGKVLEFPDKNFEDLSVVYEYYVSAAGSGDGRDRSKPMSVADMMDIIESGSGLEDATFHFTEGMHTLTEPIVLPAADKAYTITGDGKATLSGGFASRIFRLPGDCNLVTVKDLTLTEGSATESGGLAQIGDKGPLFSGCTFTGTTTSEKGGALRIETADKGCGRFDNCIFSGLKASDGGALVITNAGTEGNFTRCVFEGNSATGSGGVAFAGNGTLVFNDCIFGGAEGKGNSAASSGGVIIANNSNTLTVHINGGEASYNSASNGGFIYCNKNDKFMINGMRVHHNTATTEGGAILVPSGAWSPLFYINACSFINNTASQNGYCVYLNTSTAGNFAGLCINNSTFYNAADMPGNNASMVCNKGKSLILNSTFHAKTSKWGTFALGVHKNYGDPYGCLLLNSIFVNAAAGKPAIYQTGANYYTIARNCIASAVSENAQFTRTDVTTTVPALTYGDGFFAWNGATSLPLLQKYNIEAILSNPDYVLGEDFLAWLTRLGALDVDQRGAGRISGIWPGAYQNEEELP